MIEKMSLKRIQGILIMRNPFTVILLGLFLMVHCTVFGQIESCTDCVECGGLTGVPCCNIWNACNYGVSHCYTNDGCPASTIDPTTGCDLACTPIDSGILFLLLGGAAFGGVMLARRKVTEELVSLEV